MSITNILTVDVEDYFHVSALAKNISVDQWENQSCRVERNTHKLLDLFDEKGVKATHFVLGWVAKRYPELIKEISNRGHEVACHGYSHQLVYNQSIDVFRDETTRSKQLLEDIIGDSVKGYRAASYSITRKSYWALDVLVEAGFEYDSSIFPVRHDNYGIPGFPREPHVVKTDKGNTIIEFPLTTYNYLSLAIPVAGGGYFRLYPYWLSRFFYKNINKKGNSFIFYLHPWEIDPEQPRVKTSMLSRFRHYNNLDKCENRLSQLLSEFSFTTMGDVVHKIGN